MYAICIHTCLNMFRVAIYMDHDHLSAGAVLLPMNTACIYIYSHQCYDVLLGYDGQNYNLSLQCMCAGVACGCWTYNCGCS